MTAIRFVATTKALAARSGEKQRKVGSTSSPQEQLVHIKPAQQKQVALGQDAKDEVVSPDYQIDSRENKRKEVRFEELTILEQTIEVNRDVVQLSQDPTKEQKAPAVREYSISAHFDRVFWLGDFNYRIDLTRSDVDRCVLCTNAVRKLGSR